MPSHLSSSVESADESFFGIRERSDSVLQPPYRPTAPEMIRHLAGAFGDADAVVRGASRLTFRELERRSALLARGLLAQGVGKGSHVAILMPNGPEFAAAFFAATRIGAIALPMSTLYQPPELRWVLNHADIDTLLIQDRYLGHDYVERLEAAFPALAGRTDKSLRLAAAPYLRRIHVWGRADVSWAYEGSKALEDAAAADAEIDEEFLVAVERNVTPADNMFMIYTSGSTADPKGVVHTHGAEVRHAHMVGNVYYPFSPGERLVAGRPWFWIAGLSTSLLNTLGAGACVMIPEAESGAEAERLIVQEGATLFGSVGEFFGRINAHFEAKGEDAAVFQIHAGIAGLARKDASGTYRFVSPNLEALVPGRLMPMPQRRIPSFYGMTETLAAHSVERVPSLMPIDKQTGSGRAMPGFERKVVDPETGAMLPPGEVGECYVRGFGLMAGLYKKERSEVFDADGWYPTGDLVALDQDDFLFFKARRGDMLKISGANVAPPEVERALMGIAGVAYAVVVGLPQGGRGPLLVAAVALHPGVMLSEAEIIAQMKPLLSAYKVPKRIYFMAREDFPVTANGKIRKHILVEMLADRAAAEREAAVG